MFLNNMAVGGSVFSGYGGGVRVLEGSPEFVNCLFAGNSATTSAENPPGGGAIELVGFDATATMVNCTFSGNSSEEFGGAIIVTHDAQLQLVNCVLWGNEAPTGPEIRIGYTDPDPDPGTVTVSYSDIAGGAAGVSISDSGTLNWGVGNIDQDPLFVTNPTCGDFFLSPDSPCIDVTPTPGGTAVLSAATDLCGNPRFVDGPGMRNCQWWADTCGDPSIGDMGAYEFQGDHLLLGFQPLSPRNTIDFLAVE